MLKLPSRKILLLVGAMLIVLLVFGVVGLWPISDLEKVELKISRVDWQTNTNAQVTVVLTNGNSRAIGIPKLSSENFEIKIEDESGTVLIPHGRGFPPGSFVFQELPPRQSITNSIEVSLWSPRVRLSVFVRAKYSDLKVKGINSIHDRFPNLLPRRVVEEWGKIPAQDFYSDWITNTGIVSTVSDP